MVGNVYDYRWILDSIRQQQMLNPDKYLLKTIDFSINSTQYGDDKKLSGQRTRFTIRELMKIFKVIMDNPSKKNKNSVYWQRFIKKGCFPGRSVNSINAQW
jgi:hypothetical protein